MRVDPRWPFEEWFLPLYSADDGDDDGGDGDGGTDGTDGTDGGSASDTSGGKDTGGAGGGAGGGSDGSGSGSGADSAGGDTGGPSGDDTGGAGIGGEDGGTPDPGGPGDTGIAPDGGVESQPLSGDRSEDASPAAGTPGGGASVSGTGGGAPDGEQGTPGDTATGQTTIGGGDQAAPGVEKAPGPATDPTSTAPSPSGLGPDAQNTLANAGIGDIGGPSAAPAATAVGLGTGVGGVASAADILSGQDPAIASALNDPTQAQVNDPNAFSAPAGQGVGPGIIGGDITGAQVISGPGAGTGFTMGGNQPSDDNDVAQSVGGPLAGGTPGGGGTPNAPEQGGQGPGTGGTTPGGNDVATQVGGAPTGALPGGGGLNGPDGDVTNTTNPFGEPATSEDQWTTVSSIPATDPNSQFLDPNDPANQTPAIKGDFGSMPTTAQINAAGVAQGLSGFGSQPVDPNTQPALGGPSLGGPVTAEPTTVQQQPGGSGNPSPMTGFRTGPDPGSLPMPNMTGPDSPNLPGPQKADTGVSPISGGTAPQGVSQGAADVLSGAAPDGTPATDGSSPPADGGSGAPLSPQSLIQPIPSDGTVPGPAPADGASPPTQPFSLPMIVGQDGSPLGYFDTNTGMFVPLNSGGAVPPIMPSSGSPILSPINDPNGAGGPAASTQSDGGGAPLGYANALNNAIDTGP